MPGHCGTLRRPPMRLLAVLVVAATVERCLGVVWRLGSAGATCSKACESFGGCLEDVWPQNYSRFATILRSLPGPSSEACTEVVSASYDFNPSVDRWSLQCAWRAKDGQEDEEEPESDGMEEGVPLLGRRLRLHGHQRCRVQPPSKTMRLCPCGSVNMEGVELDKDPVLDRQAVHKPWDHLSEELSSTKPKGFLGSKGAQATSQPFRFLMAGLTLAALALLSFVLHSIRRRLARGEQTWLTPSWLPGVELAAVTSEPYEFGIESTYAWPPASYDSQGSANPSETDDSTTASPLQLVVTDASETSLSPASETLLSPEPRASALRIPSSVTEPEPEAEMTPGADSTAKDFGTDMHLTAPEIVQTVVSSQLAAFRAGALGNMARSTAELGRGAIRVLMLYATPLVHRFRGRAEPMEPLPVEKDWEDLVEADREATAIRLAEAPRTFRSQRPAGQRLAAQPATSTSLLNAIAPAAAGNAPVVLHLSMHGMGSGLVLEDGRGTAQLLDCDQLREIVALRCQGSTASGSGGGGSGGGSTGSSNISSTATISAQGTLVGTPGSLGPRLVVCSTCSSKEAGECFAEGGIPHVICTTTSIFDSWARLFMRQLYTALFQGQTVAKSFEAARVALRCDPVIPRAAADVFCLLPHDAPHDEVLFPVRSDFPVLQNASALSGAEPRAMHGPPPRETNRGRRTSLTGTAARWTHLLQTRTADRDDEDITSSDSGAEAGTSTRSHSVGSIGAESGSGDVRLDELERPMLPWRRARSQPRIRRHAASSPLEQSLPSLPDCYLGREEVVVGILQALRTRGGGEERCPGRRAPGLGAQLGCEVPCCWLCSGSSIIVVIVIIINLGQRRVLDPSDALCGVVRAP